MTETARSFAVPAETRHHGFLSNRGAQAMVSRPEGYPHAEAARIFSSKVVPYFEVRIADCLPALA